MGFAALNPSYFLFATPYSRRFSHVTGSFTEKMS
jgi:hypothetical protein